MQTKLCPHWAPEHQSQQDEKWFQKWRPPFIKIMGSENDNVTGLDIALRCVADGGKVIIRNHPISENWGQRGLHDKEHALEMGRTHAAAYGEMMDKVFPKFPEANPEQLLFEGLNEPHEWSDEPAELTAAYYVEFMKQMNARGFKVIALNLGVGWPGNGEPAAPPRSPPIWWPYRPVVEAIDKYGGYLGLHEYWYKEGPRVNWGWWAGRYLTCPWNTPIIFTECGFDSYVAEGGGCYGYHGYGPDGRVNAELYMRQCADYDGQLLLTPNVKGACIFTYDFHTPQWATFDIRNDQWMFEFFAYTDRLAMETQNDTPWPLPDYLPDLWLPDPGTPTPPQPTPIWGHKNLTQWYPLIKKYADLRKINAQVIGTIIMVETGGRCDPNMVNSLSQATGLMQVIPVESGYSWAKDRPMQKRLLVPEVNIDWGTRILREYLDAYSQQLARALAGYYGGNVLAKNLDLPASVKYITEFRKWWVVCWGTDPPVQIGEPQPPPASIPVDLNTIHWDAEEATRELEMGMASLNKARRRLIDKIIAPLEPEGN